MLIAYNNDIEFRSRWYHIQTEDNGLKDGHITTTVFHSGQILDSKTTSYKDAIAGVTDTEEQNRIIKDMMVKQHQMFYTKLYEGSYEAQMQALGQKPNGGTASNAPKPITHAASAAHGEASALGNIKKPDILRASQQAPGLSKLGLKSLTNLGSKSLAGQVPVVHPSVNRAASASGLPASQPAVAESPNRVAFLSKPLVVSKAVSAEKLRRRKRAWAGFAWPSDDRAIDVLVMSLLDSK